MTLAMGGKEMDLGGRYLGELREANALLGDMDALRARMEEDGYLLLRRLHDPVKVEATRRVILEKLQQNGQLDASAPMMDGIIGEGATGAFLGGQKELTHAPEFLNVVEAPELMQFFAEFLGGPSLTYSFKWLRVTGTGGFTGAHYDIVYMGRGTKKVFTCWTPLGDTPYPLGPLAILVGSHRFDKVKETYGEMDVDRDHVTGWFSNDPKEMVDRFGGQWQSSEFQMGDALIFGMFTMHGALDNSSNRYRLSCDTRYQRADEPADERWVGENPLGHYAWEKGETVPMEEARRRWGI